VTQATRAGQLTLTDYLDRAWREGAMWALICVALYLVIALATYSPTDSGWSYVGVSDSVSNAGGPFGAMFADLALFLFGLFAYLLPAMVAWSAYLVFRQPAQEPETKLFWLALRWTGFLMTLAAGSALASLHVDEALVTGLADSLQNGVGGGLGLFVADQATGVFGDSGTTLFLIAVLFIGFMLSTGLSPLLFIDGVGELVLSAAHLPRLLRRAVARLPLPRLPAFPAWREWARLPRLAALRILRAPLADAGADADDEPDEGASAPARDGRSDPPRHRAVPSPAAQRKVSLSDQLAAATREAEAPLSERSPPGAAQRKPTSTPMPEPEPEPTQAQDPTPAPRTGIPSFFKPFRRSEAKTDKGRNDLSQGCDERPPLELLDAPRRSGTAVSPLKLEEMSRELEARLAEFGVAAEVVAVHPGPVVALFELDLAPGLKVSKITGLAKDIARALSKVSVRVVEVIPGKSVIGLEVPNDHREMVVLSEILGSKAYADAASPLTIGMGTNISGEPVVADLGRMPHALIAGTTGSGKSVAINAMILSLVYKAGPEDVRLIMVDPKMLELSVYEGIPHLLTPVVTDMKEAANALRWCVGEMERRYKLMASLGVRNIAGYNRKVQEAIDAGEPLPDPTYHPEPGDAGFGTEDGLRIPTLERLPYIVVIIDELADMMMVVGKKVEELIARLAQKARASGIHLLLATQRPSVDVLTGLIKANIPTRMAFKVSARVDSRTVLDQMGAEHLLGHGDMLYLPPGGSIPQRVHGAFVDDHEVHRVVDYLKQQGAPDYIDTILQEPSEHLPGIDPEPRGGGDVEDQDPLFDEAVQIVVESRRASISGVQRRLKIGYNRAARMIEEMERIGVVGPAETNGNREVLAPAPQRDN
jgi:S-DNA-T family DNA segregation ATPase FtsK/SpoIIIE